MPKPLEYADELRKQWGALVTSGALIGALGIWQGLGHNPPHSVYWLVASVGLAIASYKAWLAENSKYEAGIAALESERSLHGGPEISFSWSAAPPSNTRKTLFLENSGPIDAFEVKVSDIGLNKGHCRACFPVVPKCPKGSVSQLAFDLYGDVVLPEPERNNLEMVVYASQADVKKDEHGEPVVDFPISVTFEEYGGAAYEAQFRFVADSYLSKADIHRISRKRISREGD